jgi:hypothetical protein
MIRLWDSLSGRVCDTSLMKKTRPSLLLSPIGFLNSVVCKAVRLVIRDRLFLHQRVRLLTYLSCCPGDQSIFRGS